MASDKKAAVINMSAPHYNLGCEKLQLHLEADGYQVERFNSDPGLFLQGFDLVCLSVIFSWHAPAAATIAQRLHGKVEVWAGGPGLFKLQDWWRAETGNQAISGLDQRFEKQAGKFHMTFASRGCPVGCWFCIVPKLEGKKFTLYWDFQPAPILCDNNLSALPADFQQHIVDTYVRAGARLLDANSGFEPATFTEETYERWRALLRGPWRMAFDYLPEISHVRRALQILRGEAAYKKQVYVLIGNEPIESCYQRARQVIEWGAQPFCQYVLPLDFLGGEIPAKHDWTPQLLKDFCRYFNRHLWRKVPLTEYSNRKGERPPFADLPYMDWCAANSAMVTA
jgi:hypothetical protein